MFKILISRIQKYARFLLLLLLLFLVLVFWFGWLADLEAESHCVVQAGLRFTIIFLHWPSKCWITDMHPHTRTKSAHLKITVEDLYGSIVYHPKKSLRVTLTLPPYWYWEVEVSISLHWPERHSGYKGKIYMSWTTLCIPCSGLPSPSDRADSCLCHHKLILCHEPKKLLPRENVLRQDRLCQDASATDRGIPLQGCSKKNRIKAGFEVKFGSLMLTQKENKDAAQGPNMCKP